MTVTKHDINDDLLRLLTLIPAVKLSENEPMSRHTTLRVGGPAQYYLEVSTVSALQEVLGALDQFAITPFLLGKGSNLLVSDSGFAGAVIQLGGDFSSIEYPPGSKVRAGAGVLLTLLALDAHKHSLAGFEWMAGIPGTVGGAVAMNAGAAGAQMSDLLESVEVITAQFAHSILLKDELDWQYRQSSLPTGSIITAVTLQGQAGDADTIKHAVDELQQARAATQPLDKPTAGSTFRNPAGDSRSAGELIELAGLKGLSVGGASVSQQHANFIETRSGATATDVFKLMCLIKSQVKARFAVDLVPEIKTLGQFELV